MQPVLLTFTLVSIIGILSFSKAKDHNQQFEKCKIKPYQKKFDVLPGRGWDNLQNQPKAQILALNFSKCQFSQDNKYLLPDYVTLTPIKMSEVILSADSFSHFANYTSVTSQSINVDARGSFFGFGVSGSYSKEKEQVKEDQLYTKSSIIRVDMRYNVFKALAEPNVELDPTFRNRLLDIAGLMIEGKDSLYPSYLADMIVRDYGTHVIKSIDAGAVLSKVDCLSSDYVKHLNSDSNKVGVTAAASFGSIFGMSARYSTRVTQTEINEYDTNCQKSRIETNGGTLYGAKFTVDEWRLSVMDNLIAIDKTGDPIYYVITPKNLKYLDDFSVNKLYELIKSAVKRYYSANSRIGCLDFMAPNFNIDANIDSKHCETPKVTFSFGGVFQTCSGPEDQCGSARQANPLTGTYSCPPNYESVLLNSQLLMCREYCRSSWIFWKKCNSACSFYELHWCYPTDVSKSALGYRFGGFISSKMKSCPAEYFPIKVGLTAQMCVSINNNPRDLYAIHFGGLYSCSIGNPLARSFVTDKNNVVKGLESIKSEKWQPGCANGYVSHLVSIDQGCEIAYCTETNKVSLGSAPKILKPPFITLNYNPNSTKVVVYSAANGKVLIKTQLGNWETDEVKIKEKKLILGSVFGTFFVVLFLALAALFIQRRIYKKKFSETQRESLLIEPTSSNYGSINESA